MGGQSDLKDWRLPAKSYGEASIACSSQRGMSKTVWGGQIFCAIHSGHTLDKPSVQRTSSQRRSIKASSQALRPIKSRMDWPLGPFKGFSEVMLGVDAPKSLDLRFAGGPTRIGEADGQQPEVQMEETTLRSPGAIDRPLSVWKNHDSKGLQRHRTGSMLRIEWLIVQPRR